MSPTGEFAVEVLQPDGRWTRTQDDDGEARWPTEEAAQTYIASRTVEGGYPRRVVPVQKKTEA